jgi:general secretion pathway protein A
LELSGTAGSGKTTLLTWVLQKLPPAQIQSSVILNPTLTRDEFIEMVMLDFGIQDIPASKAHRLWLLQQFLLKGHQDGKVNVLVIDEAHKLSAELLEEIRLLGNFERADEKLLQVVLIGQSELDDVLSRPELWQFKQRISVRLSLRPLEASEIERYISHRWTVAGGKNGPPFSAGAITNIAEWSSGIPRLINSICDNALLLAFADVASSVDTEHINAAATDLRLTKEKPAIQAPPTPPNPATPPTAATPARPAAPTTQAASPMPVTPLAVPAAVPKARPIVRSSTRSVLGLYGTGPVRRSIFSRWASKLGLA